MVILNLTGNTGWQPIPTAPRNYYQIIIQHDGAATVSVRLANDPTKIFTIKANGQLMFTGTFEQNQIEVAAATGTIEVIINPAMRG